MISTFPELPLAGEDTIHCPQRTEISPLIEKRCKYLPRRFVHVSLAVERFEHLLAFLFAQGSMRRRPVPGLPYDLRPSVAVIRGSGYVDRLA